MRQVLHCSNLKKVEFRLIKKSSQYQIKFYLNFITLLFPYSLRIHQQQHSKSAQDNLELNNSKEENIQLLPKMLNLKETQREPEEMMNPKIKKQRLDTENYIEKIPKRKTIIQKMQKNQTILYKKVYVTEETKEPNVDQENVLEEISIVKSKTKIEIEFNGNLHILKIPKSSVTLEDIKEHLKKQPTKYGMLDGIIGFSVKSLKNGKVVIEEIDEEDESTDILPLFGDKIVLDGWNK